MAVSASYDQVSPPKIRFLHLPVTRLLWLLPLVALMLLQTSAALGLQNTAERDEALYLSTGRLFVQEMLGGPKADHTASTYFSGVPYLYPVLAGALDMIGGLYLVRTVSLIFMLIATACVFYITQHLFTRNSAYLATTLFISAPAVIYLSHFATFDAMSLMCLGLSTVFALRAASSGRLSAVIVCGLLLFLALISKYAALLFAPSVLAILTWQSLNHLGMRRAILNALIVVGISVVGIVMLWTLDPGLRIGMSFTTTERVAMAAEDRVSIALEAILQAGILIVLIFVGVALLDRKRLLLGLVLAGTALLAPAYHVYTTESVSMQKHLGFGLLFGIPLAGYALAQLSGYDRRHIVGPRWAFGLLVCLFAFSIGLPKAWALYSWGGAEPATAALHTLIRPGETRILTDESSILQYHTLDIASANLWVGMDYFQYTDKTGQTLKGPESYKAAIRDGYFDLIIMGNDHHDRMEQVINAAMQGAIHYELIYSLPGWGWGRTNMLIWRRISDDSYYL